jgi:hypothetical protein
MPSIVRATRPLIIFSLSCCWQWRRYGRNSAGTVQISTNVAGRSASPLGSESGYLDLRSAREDTSGIRTPCEGRWAFAIGQNAGCWSRAGHPKLTWASPLLAGVC